VADDPTIATIDLVAHEMANVLRIFDPLELHVREEEELVFARLSKGGVIAVNSNVKKQPTSIYSLFSSSFAYLIILNIYHLSVNFPALLNPFESLQSSFQFRSHLFLHPAISISLLSSILHFSLSKLQFFICIFLLSSSSSLSPFPRSSHYLFLNCILLSESSSSLLFLLS